MRAKELVARAIEGKATKFLTLTVSQASGPDPVARCRNLIDAWRKMRRTLIEQHGYAPIEFLAVVEAQKSGEPHLHIIMRSPRIDQAWISEFMAVEIGAPIVWIEEVEQKRKLANYVAKYCGKSPQRFGTLKRFWTSKNWTDRSAIEASVADQIWDTKGIVDSDLESWERNQVALGARIEQRGKWTVARFDPLDENQLAAIRADYSRRMLGDQALAIDHAFEVRARALEDAVARFERDLQRAGPEPPS